MVSGRGWPTLVATAASVVLLAAIGRAGSGPWHLPAGFPRPRVPVDNPMTPQKVELGRRLFHDPRLSGNEELACSGCHRPELAYTDGRARAVGAEGDSGQPQDQNRDKDRSLHRSTLHDHKLPL